MTGGLYRALVKAVDDLSLDLAVIDPAIKAHGLDESSNPEIDAFAAFSRVWRWRRTSGWICCRTNGRGLRARGRRSETQNGGEGLRR